MATFEAANNFPFLWIGKNGKESPTPKFPCDNKPWSDRPVIKSRKVLGANGKAVYMGIMIKSYNRTNTSTWRFPRFQMINRVNGNGPS